MADSIFLGSVYATLEMRKDEWGQSIKTAQSELDTLESQSRSRMASIGNGFTSAGKALSIGLTAPLTIFGKLAVDTAVDIEVRWKEVQKVYGSTAGAFQKDVKMLENSVDSLSTKFGRQKSEVLDALSAIAAIGFEGPRAVDMLTQSLEFATAGNMELNSAMEGVVAISKIYNVEGEALRKVLANLNLTENSTAASMADLKEAVQTAGSVAKTAGVDVKELSGFMAVLREKAIPAGEAAEGLKTIFTRLRSTAVGDLEAIGVSIDLGNGKLKEGDQILVEVAKKWQGLTDVQKEEVSASAAGVYQKNKFLAIMDDLSGKTSTYSNTLKVLADDQNSVSTYTKEMNIFLDTNRTKLAQSKVSFDNMKIAMGGVLVEALVPLVNKLAEFAKWFNTLDPKIQKTVVYFGIFLAVLGPILIIVGSLITAITTIGGALAAVGGIAGIVSGIFGAFGAILAVVFSPITLIVAAIGLLIAAGILLYKNWGIVSDFLSKVWDTIVAAWNTAVSFITGLVGSILNAITTFANNVFTFFTTTLPTALIQFFTVTIPTLFFNFLTFIGTFFVNLLGMFFQGIGLILAFIVVGIPNLVETIINFLITLPSRVWSILTSVYTNFMKWGTNTYNYLVTNVPIWWDNFIKWLVQLWQNIITGLTNIFNSFVKWGTDLWNWLSTEVPRQFNEFIKWISALPGRAYNGLVDLISKVGEIISKTWKAVVDEVSQWPGRLFEWGSKMAQSFIDGFGKIVGWITGKIKEGFEAGRKMLEGHSPPVAGPFKDIDKWGFNIGKTYADAFGSGLSGIADFLLPNYNYAMNVEPRQQQGQSNTNTSYYSQPTFEVNIGIYAGSEMEKRQIAKELNDALKNYQKGTGESLTS